MLFSDDEEFQSYIPIMYQICYDLMIDLYKVHREFNLATEKESVEANPQENAARRATQKQTKFDSYKN